MDNINCKQQTLSNLQQCLAMPRPQSLLVVVVHLEKSPLQMLVSMLNPVTLY